MKRTIRIGITILLLVMGCVIAYEKHSNRIMASEADQKIVAKINSDTITEEDLDFYKVINRIRVEMNREADRNRLQGKELEESISFWNNQEKAAMDRNTLLTQMIRLHAAALLAKEKGYTASEAEVKKEMDDVKQIYGKEPNALKMIKAYGEKRFWNKEFSQYQLIVLSKKVQLDVMNQVKKANTKAEEKEIYFLANKKYEELLISQIGTLKIAFVNNR
jgi:hypothetical protein